MEDEDVFDLKSQIKNLKYKYQSYKQLVDEIYDSLEIKNEELNKDELISNLKRYIRQYKEENRLY
jgi:uncharacterized protein YaaN involved in tellurite resistance